MSLLKPIIKIIILMLLTASLLIAFCSCNQAQSVSESSVPEEQSLPEQSTVAQKPMTSDEALELLYTLLEKDKLYTDIFLGGYLFNGDVDQTNPNQFASYPLKSTSEYYNISSLEQGMSELYLSSSTANAFFAYPSYGEKAVSSRNGITYASLNGKTSFNYPENEAFVLTTLSFTEAIFDFQYNGSKYKISIELESEKLSDSVYCIVQSSYNGKWESNPLLDTLQNAGSASRLSGNILIVNVFMDDRNSEWSQESQLEALELQQRGIDIITGQAERYGLEISITASDISNSLLYKRNDSVGTSPADQIWINEMFAYTTYGSLDAYITSFFEVDKYDSYCVFFHLNKAGESYSVCCDSGSFDTSLYFCERSVMFYGDTDTCASDKLFAQELLYMFGAKQLSNEEYASYANAYFPDDIMLSGSIIGDYTAFRIGWLNTRDELLSVFD